MITRAEFDELKKEVIGLRSIIAVSPLRVDRAGGALIMSLDSIADTFRAKITANDPSYTFAEVTFDGTNWNLKTGGKAGTAINLAEYAQSDPELVPVNSIVEVVPITVSGTKYYFFSRDIGAGEDYSGGELLELAYVQAQQDTDDWDKSEDDQPVTIRIITDIEYSSTDDELTYRTRTLQFDRGGNLLSISAESDPKTLIAESIEHT